VKLCLSIEIQEGLTYGKTLALAGSAEGAGFDAVLLAEHYTSSAGAGAEHAADAWIYLAALARDTGRIRLGTLVSPVTFRHPSVLAKLAASLDHVSDGRAELGLGAGWLEAEHTAYGLPFPPAGRRVDMLEEQLQVIKGLWTHDTFNHTGSLYELTNCRFTPKPVQKPHPPLIVGGRPGSRRIRTLASRHADEYVISLATVDECTTARQALDDACALSLFTYACVGDSDADVERRLGRLVPGLRPEMRTTTRWIVGTSAQVASHLGRLRDAGVARVFVAAWDEEHHDLAERLRDAASRM
jgi:alkanesulfonate monooxygenase SsuD/methylene tetrahydromethanopterin reductase-like flavin-dependent oxidoreductase (luciferase family)